MCSAVNGVCVAPTANDAAFRKGSREGRRRDAEGRRVETEEGCAGEGKWRMWVAALTVAAIPEAPASASAARRESTEDETREKERPRGKERKSETDRDGKRGTKRKRDGQKGGEAERKRRKSPNE